MSHDHDHDHDHDHGSRRAALPLRAERRLAPSRQGTVVLDIGDGVGALVVHAPGELCGVEIEIAHRGQTTPLVHTEVRERVLPEGSVYAGVFLALDEGDYTLLGAGTHTARDVTIESGKVAELELAAH